MASPCESASWVHGLESELTAAIQHALDGALPQIHTAAAA